MNFFNNENLLNTNLDLPTICLDNYVIIDKPELLKIMSCKLELGCTYRITVTYNGQAVTKEGVPFPSLLFHNKDLFGVNRVEFVEKDSMFKLHIPNRHIENINGIKVDFSDLSDIIMMPKEHVVAFASLYDLEKEVCLNRFRSTFSVLFEKVKLVAQITAILKHSDTVTDFINKDNDKVNSLDLNLLKLEYIKADF